MRRRELAGAHPLALAVGDVAVLGVRDLLDRAADELALRVAEQLAQPPIGAHEAAIEADVRDARGGELEGLAEALLALAQRRLGLALRADVDDGRDHAVVLELAGA